MIKNLRSSLFPIFRRLYKIRQYGHYRLFLYLEYTKRGQVARVSAWIDCSV